MKIQPADTRHHGEQMYLHLGWYRVDAPDDAGEVDVVHTMSKTLF